MENIIKNPGLQPITELILFNLDFEALKMCQLLNKFFKEILEDSMFWLRKWRIQNGLSKKNYDDWAKAIQLAKNTNVEVNVKLYLEKVIKMAHVVDVPCFIDSDAVQKSSEYTFERAYDERELGILQILASMKDNPNEYKVDSLVINAIDFAAMKGHLNIIKILAPITKNPNSIKKQISFTPMHYAAFNGDIGILKFLVSFTSDLNSPPFGTIHMAAAKGHTDVLKFLAPLTKHPNEGKFMGSTPIECAQYNGHHEFVRLLQSFISTGHF